MSSPDARPPRRPWSAYAATGAAALLIPVLVGGFVQQTAKDRSGPQLFAQVLERVERFAVDSVSQDALYEKAARGLVEQIGDPYADLFSPAELAEFNREEIGNDYGGLGLLIEDQEGLATVTQVFPGTPAAEGGVLTGDRIVRVDTTDTRGKPLDAVSRLLLGPTGTAVTVTFARAGVTAPIVSSFKRSQVHIPAVPYAIMLEGEVGYIPLQRFNSSAAAEVAGALVKLARQGAKSFVVDVRGNTGGDMDQSLAISELFLNTGQELASLRARGSDSANRFVARRRALVPEAPVVVLTDGSTASASEIVAGSLQDHDRALVVGQPSFGKGLVQSLYPLEGGWALKLTTAKWYTPSGRSLHRDRGEDGRPIPMADSVRPMFKSDAGRPIYGGGGITPDVVVQPDTLTKVESDFLRTLAPKSSQSYVALYDIARELKTQVAPDFTVRPEWRADFRQRVEKAGVKFAPGQFEAATPFVDRMLEARIASLAFGDSSAFRRTVPHDAQLSRALAMLRQATTQPALLALAARAKDRGA